MKTLTALSGAVVWVGMGTNWLPAGGLYPLAWAFLGAGIYSLWSLEYGYPFPTSEREEEN